MEMFVAQSQKSVREKTSSLVDNVTQLSREFESEMVTLVETFKAIVDRETLCTKEQISSLSTTVEQEAFKKVMEALVDQQNERVFLALAKYLTSEKELANAAKNQEDSQRNNTNS